MANPAPGYAKKPEHRSTSCPRTGGCALSLPEPSSPTAPRRCAVEETGHEPVHDVPDKGTPPPAASDRPQDLLPVQGRLLVLDARRLKEPKGTKQAENAIWGYREPYDEATGMAGHYAFYKTRVDAIEVQ